jgi:hypothetical protein
MPAASHRSRYPLAPAIERCAALEKRALQAFVRARSAFAAEDARETSVRAAFAFAGRAPLAGVTAAALVSHDDVLRGLARCRATAAAQLDEVRTRFEAARTRRKALEVHRARFIARRDAVRARREERDQEDAAARAAGPAGARAAGALW